MTVRLLCYSVAIKLRIPLTRTRARHLSAVSYIFILLVSSQSHVLFIAVAFNFCFDILLNDFVAKMCFMLCIDVYITNKAIPRVIRFERPSLGPNNGNRFFNWLTEVVDKFIVRQITATKKCRSQNCAFNPRNTDL